MGGMLGIFFNTFCDQDIVGLAYYTHKKIHFLLNQEKIFGYLHKQSEQCLEGIKNETWCDYRNIIMKPQKTSFSNISKISAGYDHSLFQNNKEQYFYVLILITDNVDWVIIMNFK